MKSFYTFSFGCRVNEAEKEEIDRKLLKKGYSFDNINPNLYIINSCAITHKAEREARQHIYQIKKKLPNSKIIVTGCSATYWLKNHRYKNLPIDMIVDNTNKEYLIDLIEKRLFDNRKSTNKINQSNQLTNKFIGSGRVMIKIQDGCQRFCTYCIVPYLRGLPKSETIANIVKKIKKLENNTKEVILTAINTESFGYDTKENLISLLKEIINKTITPRISLGSIHPWSVNNQFFQFYKEYLPLNRLVNFFHIPLQSGSNKILSLMKRGYKREEMLDKIKKIKEINPYAFIGTDIIVGFLDETEKDFEETYNYLKNAPIDKFHVFRFSIRDKTQAYYMAKRLKEPTSYNKEKRAEKLIKLGKTKYNNFLKKNLNRISSVLILEKTENNQRVGLLDNQLPILIKDDIRIIKPGIIKKVKVIEYKNGKLFGKII